MVLFRKVETDGGTLWVGKGMEMDSPGLARIGIGGFWVVQ